MSTVLVTVVSPHRTIDVEAPGDIPIGELIAPLLALCVTFDGLYQVAAHAQWSLGVPGGTPFPSSESLIDCSILDGSLLLFQDADAWQRERQRMASAAQAHPHPPTPGGIEIRWNRGALLPGA